MYAIVNLNGKQVQVEEGRYVIVDRLPHQPDEEVRFEEILMVIDGDNSLVGLPFVEGATVKATVLTHLRGKKQLVYKMRCKKGYRKKNGHRQELTRLQINVVDFPGRKGKPAKESVKESAKTPDAPAKEKPQPAPTSEISVEAEEKAVKKAKAEASVEEQVAEKTTPKATTGTATDPQTEVETEKTTKEPKAKKAAGGETSGKAEKSAKTPKTSGEPKKPASKPKKTDG